MPRTSPPLPPVPPSLASRLEAAEQAQARYVEKTAKCNKKAEKYKMAVQAKSQKKAEKYTGKAEKYASKAAEKQKDIVKTKVKIEIALRITRELNAQKPGIVAMFQSVLEDGSKFARDFDIDPELAVYKAIFALAKDKRKIHLPVKQGPASIRDYKWSDNGATIIPAEAVILLVPALAHGPHKDRKKAFKIVRKRIRQLNIHHTNCADNLSNPGWSKSSRWWVAHLSAFVRDVVPILPAVKKEIDECRGCNACRAARRRP